MIFSTLQLTRFEVERLVPAHAKNRSVPYLINTYHGKKLGEMGYIPESYLASANDAEMIQPASRPTRNFARYSIGRSVRRELKRLLTMQVW